MASGGEELLESQDTGTVYGGTGQRTGLPDSGPWICSELCITVISIVASIVVLSISRDEKPQAPLRLWITGYAAGCLATLPLLYWRYTHLHVRPRDLGTLPTSSTTPPAHTSTPSNDASSYKYLADNQGTASSGSGSERAVERFTAALNCLFLVWFVVGNVWFFGGGSSSSYAPNLYRLCIVFLTFNWILYSISFALCAAACFCLPCITWASGRS